MRYNVLTIYVSGTSGASIVCLLLPHHKKLIVVAGEKPYGCPVCQTSFVIGIDEIDMGLLTSPGKKRQITLSPVEKRILQFQSKARCWSVPHLIRFDLIDHKQLDCEGGRRQGLLEG